MLSAAALMMCKTRSGGFKNRKNKILTPKFKHVFYYILYYHVSTVIQSFQYIRITRFVLRYEFTSRYHYFKVRDNVLIYYKTALSSIQQTHLLLELVEI